MLSPGSQKPVILMATPRSGSTLVATVVGKYLLKRFGTTNLGDALNTEANSMRDTGEGIEGAYLRDEEFQQLTLRASKAEIARAKTHALEVRRRLRLLHRYRGRYFYKVFPSNLALAQFERLARTHRILCLERRNLFDQVLSFGISLHTGAWVQSTHDAALQPRSIRLKPGPILHMEYQYVRYHWYKRMIRPLATLVYEDFQKAATSRAILKKAFAGESLMKFEAELPRRQNSGDKLRFYSNPDEIIGWYRESALQGLWPV